MLPCEARYGKPFDEQTGGTSKGYKVGSFTLWCYFFDGKCDAVSYYVTGESQTLEVVKDPMNEKQVMRLLQMNAVGWNHSEKSEYGAAFEGGWTTGDGALNARITSRCISIETAQRTARGLIQLTPGQIDAAIFSMEKVAK